ncbi:hypothetical protein PK98_10610 [Croceibacterium mercuriale]|uniref:Vitamin K epoxide reductase domain-containing protein n=1 Tax=Croceibacterium mercuriale TaxID=1572751 RepID=A0A0B2BWU7_9SPHN|nr:vitamin K epoxide reductase family protein [Croceibacterium mercuriale]KHL24467.1 hypothetical protein PK98_10610 [Croceibacterium mercuriale]
MPSCRTGRASLPGEPGRNGTEAVVTSAVSQAFPIPDAALGGYTYALEIATGIIGSQARWRTMPWLVFLFGLMIAPLGVVSITFVIIQPVVIGTWATLTLVGAAAMLVQIPYSLDELLETLQFVRRRAQAGRPWLRVFLSGDTDGGKREPVRDEFDCGAGTVLADMWGGGVNLPWNLALAGLIPPGGALLVTPVLFDAGSAHTVASIVAGAALIALSLRHGAVREHHGSWDRRIA